VHICFDFTTRGVPRGASVLGMPNVPKEFADGPINMAPLRKKEKL